MGFDVLVENPDELGYDVVALERSKQAAIYVGGGFGLFEGALQGNAQAGVISLKKVRASSV